MSGLGLFQPSTLGMKSESHRLNTIGYNIANVNSGGFKRTDTAFHTLLSDNIFQQYDNGGVKPYSIATNDIQGLVQGTDRNLDLAIVGSGFFAVQPSFSGTDQIYYTRDGSFQINTVDGQTSSVTADDGSTITVNNGYLVDKNGYFVLGFPPASDGTFSSSGTPVPLRVDQYAFLDQGKATTDSTLQFNLPAGANFGDDAESYTLTTYDSNGTARNISFNFSRTVTDNEWRIDYSADNLTSGDLTPSAAFSFAGGGTTNYEFTFDGVNNTIQALDLTTGLPVAGAFEGLTAGDQITITGGANDGQTFTIASINSQATTLTVGTGLVTDANTGATDISIGSTSTLTNALVFNGKGELQSPTELTFSATWDDGGTSSFTIDISTMTQFAGSFTPYRTFQDGYGIANLTDVKFDSAGQVVGAFSDGTERVIYKIPLYDFTNPNGLKSSNGMLFSETEESGSATAFFADESSKASLMPNAVETSNVDIAMEFTRMIQTQTAYNMSSTTFKTIDEMLTVARDLKT